MKENYRRIDMKRKCFAKGKSQRFKRFKRMPKFIKDNVENQVAKEKDVYDFSDSEEEDERANELGMGLEISDLPFLNDDNYDLDKHKALIGLTQDSVAPLFRNDLDFDESKLVEALRELKLSQFRPNQKETIKRILMGRSTLFISPTGSGKSLCYQMPALLYWRYRKYITIVVSPLISLMDDQIKNMPASLKAVTIHSNQNIQQRRNSIQQLVTSEAQVAFITPEAIVGGLLELEDLKNLPAVGFVCIDEAHCLSEWSHNFRPAYMQFTRILNEQLNVKTFLALTATATKATTFDISKCLRINPEDDVIGATKIPDNLILSISYESNKERAIIELLKSPTFRIMPSIIVYCSRREDTERVAATIRTAMQSYSTIVEFPERVKRGCETLTNENSAPGSKKTMKLAWDAETYHAGLSSHARASVQRKFIKGEIRVVVATIAFGMGINKSNVRAIIHYDMPASFESYVQELGRAGRDGKPAQCHMFLRADKSDVFYQQRNIYGSITEKTKLDKLTSLMFPACRCTQLLTQAESDRLTKLNDSDSHQIKSMHRTPFTDVPVDHNDEDEEDYELLQESENISPGKGHNRPVRYSHKSLVKKHRACKGHEVAFSVDEATDCMNLFPEAIITFMCKLEQAYPQLQITQFPPTKPNCTLLCYKGTEQMEQLAARCPAVRVALYLHKKEHLVKHGSSSPYETPQKIKFDLPRVATSLGKSSLEVRRMLRGTEWELDDKTGRFRRTQVRVKFDGNAFHLKAVGDLKPEEMKELNKFLVDQMQKHESVERNKVFQMYQTLMKYCINLDQMQDKVTRLQTSMKLKTALNAYFNQPNDSYLINQFVPIDAGENKLSQLSDRVEQSIRNKAKEFVSAHGRDFKPRDIAKIFQGVSSPHYPAEHWGPNRNWWRIFVDVDFNELKEIIGKVLLQ